ncbi:hypothetical protein D5086_008172 [Populus alba]|uniref:Uncharacterized protein n=1 Tax=Populus alba TaxID=43335 RepID=A0ACC4CG89_POPAL
MGFRWPKRIVVKKEFQIDPASTRSVFGSLVGTIFIKLTAQNLRSPQRRPGAAVREATTLQLRQQAAVSAAPDGSGPEICGAGQKDSGPTRRSGPVSAQTHVVFLGRTRPNPFRAEFGPTAFKLGPAHLVGPAQPS